MIKRIAAVLLSLVPALGFAAGGAPLEHAGASINNKASLQRGAAMYMSYCAGCHAIGLQRYARIGADLDLSEDQVQRFLNPTGQKVGEQMRIAMDPADGEAWFGKTPPDLSLIARSKPGGPDWTYTFLKSFYVDETRPSGWNNTVLAGSSMPNVLWELQGMQRPIFEAKESNFKDCGADEEGCVNGKKEVRSCRKGLIEVDGQCLVSLELASPGSLGRAEYDASVRDLVNFLTYVGEPAAMQRTSVGVWVILFLAAFTFLAWLLKHEYWRDVH